MTSIRPRILAREPVFGVFSAIPHPISIELCAAAGYDMICIDWEHSQIGRDQIEGLIRAADVNGTPTFVRIPQLAEEHFATVLDAGATGVLVPRIATAAQARAAVEAMRYPPLGQRGVGPGRASGYGLFIESYVAQANQSLCLAVQIETHLAVANIEEICGVEGIDMIFVGPGDLGVSLRAQGRIGKQELDETIQHVIRTALAASRSVGIYVQSHADVPRWQAFGVSSFIVGSDVTELAGALRSQIAGLDGATSQQRSRSRG